MPYSSILTAAVALLAALPLASANVCPPLGPVLLAPRTPSQSTNLKAAVDGLRTSLDAQIKPQMKASAISIAVKSIHEDGLLFNYHFTPANLSGLGTSLVDENTIYRVGSISKLMPVLVLLQDSKVRMDDPVTKYIPGLKNATGSSEVLSVSWNDVTVGALASHLAGLGTDSAYDLAIFPTGPWAAMGLPEVPKGKGPTCSGLPGTKPCTGPDLIRDMARRPPVYREYTTPVYSNIGFAILGLVVEAATNKTFKDAVQAGVFDKVGMKSTSFDGFPKSFPQTGFIPVGESTWNLTTGVYESAGGMFSSTNDLIAFGEAILEHRLLSAPKTRQWLQPTSHTTATSFSVGAPWEISRSDILTADGRTIDIYTKTGDLGLYHGILALVPDYDIVVTVLTGGREVTAESSTSRILLSAVLKALTPAIEKAGREEALASGYLGTFVDDSTNSSLVLTVDAGPGLVIQSWTMRGFDALGRFGLYSLQALESGGAAASTGPVKADARLYPSNREGVSKQGGGNETAWRAVIDTVTDEQEKKLDDQIFWKNGTCTTWFGMDRSVYNFQGLMDFVVMTGSNGAVTAIKSPAFNITLVKGTSPTVLPNTNTNAGTTTPGEKKSAAGRTLDAKLGVFVGVLVAVLSML
ncbi:beta-lactamase/transpeptidase-like protein [Podospora didyma]|uniref:Beta-lactamase/transpeptidase-like protein n=1 Tax=Podospora didyma TaxID=330526 RepID=A0AAE0TVA7_9PEZI|nr:beta-lactamase/transpeptidase-like protein [Podospora didyma]